MRTRPLAPPLPLTLAIALGACSTAVSSAPDATPEPGAGSDAATESDARGSLDAASTVEADATLGADGGAPGPQDAGGSSAISGWTLTWSDEFDGADGTPVDPKKWTHDVGGGGWGNGEREYYTDAAQNAVQRGGTLVITATPQNASQYSCWYGSCRYTSARLKTEGLFAQQYGRFEARARMPIGKGIWPAIWMLGSDIQQVSWPACGEIDFMETIGTGITQNHGSLHAPGFNPGGTYTLPGGAKFSDDFHTFAIEWEPGTIRFYVDDNLYETRTSAGVPSGGKWAFEHPFFLIINVAVGGAWPGDPDGTTAFPQSLVVDWVRVYQKSNADL